MQRFMDEKARERCSGWIKQYLSEYPRKTTDSYVLKHMFERMTGIYASNAEFQEIMRENGFEPRDNSDSLFSVKVDSVVIQQVFYSR